MPRAPQQRDTGNNHDDKRNINRDTPRLITRHDFVSRKRILISCVQKRIHTHACESDNAASQRNGNVALCNALPPVRKRNTISSARPQSTEHVWFIPALSIVGRWMCYLIFISGNKKNADSDSCPQRDIARASGRYRPARPDNDSGSSNLTRTDTLNVPRFRFLLVKKR